MGTTCAGIPRERVLPALALEGIDGVVHLAGENIADGRWTEAKQRRIRDSRIDGTRLLCERLAQAEDKPSVLVCASAVGFYGDRGDEPLDERSARGSGFLAEVCEAWEEACQPARDAGIRVVNLRIGVVLSADGGALAKMLPPFRFGLAGKLGNGKQWMSWISLDDLVGAIDHALTHEEIEGPVNAVSPNPVTNAEFTSALGRVLSRPTALTMPAIGARVVFGKLADELLLSSIRAQPRALLASGFRFEHPDLETALRQALGRRAG